MRLPRTPRHAVDSAIFMEDSAADVERKLMQAHCPRELPAESIVEADGAAGAGAEADPMHLVKDALQNPCLDYVKHVILSAPGATFKVGERTYMDAADVRADFLAGEISEQQLKRALVDVRASSLPRPLPLYLSPLPPLSLPPLFPLHPLFSPALQHQKPSRGAAGGLALHARARAR